jgi:hypothetical protein
MTERATYWIQDVDGVKACVSERRPASDVWIARARLDRGRRHRPTGQQNSSGSATSDHGGRGVMNHAAVLLHEGLGWFPSDPPPPPGYSETCRRPYPLRPSTEPAGDNPDGPPPAAMEQEQVNG